MLFGSEPPKFPPPGPGSVAVERGENGTLSLGRPSYFAPASREPCWRADALTGLTLLGAYCWFDMRAFRSRGASAVGVARQEPSAGLLLGRKIQLSQPSQAGPSARSLGHGAAAFRMGCGASTPAAGADPIQEKFAGKDCIAHGVPLQPGEGHVQAAKLSTMSSHQVPCIVAGEAPPAPQTAKAAPAPKATPAPVPTTTTEPAAPAAVAKASSFDFEKGTFIFG